MEEEEFPEFREGEHEPMPSQEQKTMLTRLLSIFIKQERMMEELPVEPEQRDEAQEDFRELARLFLRTLERLPAPELEKFKQTSEFGNFKEILRKHKVIK